MNAEGLTLALTTTEWTTILGTAFAAIAAIASWATVATGLLAQRGAFRPNVSAGFLDDRASRVQTIHFVNAGPGLAVALGYLGIDDGRKYGGYVGKGHLLPGAEEDAPVGSVAGTDAHFVWFCRDVRGWNHIWSYHGGYRRVSVRKATRVGTKFGDWFRLMYPDIEIPA